jgi:NAD(P)-dependent dehydrogenase (short-subunit alcohol dehydrogenase family)
LAHDQFSLEGKVIAVVGAGSGIGEAIAIGAADQGASYVACLDVNEAGAAATAARIDATGARAGASAIDIADAEGTRACLEQVAAAHGSLDGLVCTPSINVRKPILSYSGDEFDRVVRINLRGNFNVLQAVGRIMTQQKRGSIVLYSSIRSIVTEPGQSVYSMTKAGILQLAKTAATEWATLGVRVNAVGPGVVETPLTAPIKSNKDWYDAYAK